ncbi:aminopeptidase N [Agromyces archimandritae]|uniref:Aminopeptidase N n=1 Tax=Agromyces archimandritae TaxID=2781962 RepID=A0A975FME1_9MICO|nr:aminopeptidase N [Agromyces archimandritae]QTX04557.1 aminopeptidase N [Agromyces archimandritae]
MTKPALTRDEAIARAAAITVDGYDIALDLSANASVFHSETTVRFAAEPGASTFIEATTLEVHEIELNGRRLEPAIAGDGYRIRLDGLEAENELRVVSTCAYSSSGEGLHRFVDPVDGERYVYTELAVAEASRVFAVFDQPDLKARFRFTVTAPEHWRVISNAPTPEPTANGDGTASWAFEPGPVISSYLAAVVGGPYAAWEGETRTLDGRTVPLGVFARASLAEHVEPEVMFETVDRGMRFFEERFGVPYPFEKYDQIFVPEYNWGAMENVGAVTFNEGYIFRSREPESRHERRMTTVLHELSHMWFGNLVTMRWWNDLWLNESFATWASMFAVAETTPFTHAWATFAADDKSAAAEQDQLPTTHPIVARIDDTADVDVNFDRITYDKGASVLRQLVAWVGLDAFLTGVGAYLRANAFGNATLDDLLAELERAGGRELGPWSEEWLETAGVNRMRARLVIDDASPASVAGLVLEQTAPGTHPVLRRHRTTVGFYRSDGGRLARTARFELDASGSETPIPEAVGSAVPELVLVNDADLDYATVRLDAASREAAMHRLGDLDDPVARAVVWGSAWDSVRHAELSPSEFVQLVVANIGKESSSVQRTLVLARLEFVLDRYLAWDRAGVAVEAGDALWALVGMAEAGSDAQLQFVKCFTRIATSAGHAALLQGLLDGSTRLDGIAIDTGLRWEIITSLAALGEADEAAIDAVLAQDDTAKGRLLAATAKAARPEQSVKDEAWRRVATDTSVSNDLARALAEGWRRSRPVELLAGSVEPYFAMLQSVWAGRGFTMASIIVTGLFPAGLVTPELDAAAREWLGSHDGPGSLRRLVLEQADELERALTAQARDAQDEPEPRR